MLVLLLINQHYSMCLCLCICMYISIGICLTLHLCYRYEDFFGKKTLSTHEKEQQKLKSKIEQMEKANIDPKTWTMQGEVMLLLLMFFFF